MLDKEIARCMHYYYLALDRDVTAIVTRREKEKKPPKKYFKINTKSFVAYYVDNKEKVDTLMTHLGLDNTMRPKDIYSTYLMNNRKKDQFDIIFYNEMLDNIANATVVVNPALPDF